MKTFLWLPLLALSSLFARADAVIEQKMESAMMNGPMKIEIKGDLIRMEMPPTMGMQTIMIMDVAKGKSTTLLPAQKAKLEMDLKAARQAAGLNSEAMAKPTPTGKKQKIGEWDAEEYTVTSGGATMHLWVAPEFPNYEAFKKELARMSRYAATGAPDPSAFDLPGMVVRTEVDSPIGKVTVTLVSAKLAPVPDSEFQIPADYQAMPMPAGVGGGQ